MTSSDPVAGCGVLFLKEDRLFRFKGVVSRPRVEPMLLICSLRCTSERVEQKKEEEREQQEQEGYANVAGVELT